MIDKQLAAIPKPLTKAQKSEAIELFTHQSPVASETDTNELVHLSKDHHRIRRIGLVQSTEKKLNRKRLLDSAQTVTEKIDITHLTEASQDDEELS